MQLLRAIVAVLTMLWCGALAAQAPATFTGKLSLPREAVESGTLALFDGETLFGWEPSGDARWSIVDGTISTAGDKPGFLVTTTEFADFRLKMQFKAPTTTNSGVFIRTASPPTDPTKDCYEINIAAPAVSPFATGSLVGRVKRTGDFVDADEWRQLVIECQGDTILVYGGPLDSEAKLLTTYCDPQPLRRGRIALQANQGLIAFREIQLTPLLREQLPLDDKLSKWKVYPGKTAEYQVTATGELSVTNGPGMLEYVGGKFDDFVLRWQVKTLAPGLNSGIFFRQIPGEFTQGYECQIHNGYKNDDRNQPADFGSGGFYRRQPARRVVGNDNEWAVMTLIAHDAHMASWVNGIQVCDWIDTRKPDDNPRKGLRTAAGTFSIQGHDPTTNILFRDFRIGTYPGK